MLTLTELLGALSGAQLGRGPGETRFVGVSTDSRQIAPGELFVALAGEHFDGHGYIAQAKARGAVAVLVSHAVDSDLPQVQVDNTRIALGEMARFWRQRFDVPVIAVVGSNGKTTTKEMVASILGEAFGADGFLATAKNLNNDIGVPLTLLSLRTRHQAAVIEIGMNHPGETAWLAGITQPTVCIITNAQREHQEFMQTVAAVANEHALAIEALAPSGVAVLPAADDYVSVWRAAAGPRPVIDYIALPSTSELARPQPPTLAQLEAIAYVQAFDTIAHLSFHELTATVHLHTAGLHNVHNAAAAASAGFALGLNAQTIASGLERFTPAPGRMQAARHMAGGLLIDDTYNANPDSVIAAVRVLSERPAPRLLVLGDMGEVGEDGPAFHREIGALVGVYQISLMALGVLSAEAVAACPGARQFTEVAPLIEAVRLWLAQHGETSSVLVKGSRFMRMERVVQAVAECTSTDLPEESH